MSRVKRRGPGRRGYDRPLTLLETLHLLMGAPVGRVSPFHNDEDMRAAWAAHGHQLLEQHRAGSRPWSWWRFVAGEDRPSTTWAMSGLPFPFTPETMRLAELGELTDRELANLVGQARQRADATEGPAMAELEAFLRAHDLTDGAEAARWPA
jgi:hypothetical protein